MDVFFLVDLAATPEGRNGIRTAVESYQHSISAFHSELEGVLQGRSVSYSFRTHQFSQTKNPPLPPKNLAIAWEIDHFIHAVKTFSGDIFQGLSLNQSEYESRKQSAWDYLKNKCLKNLSSETVMTAESLQAAKIRMDNVIKDLLGKACAFEAVASSNSVPHQSTDEARALGALFSHVDNESFSNSSASSSTHFDESVIFSRTSGKEKVDVAEKPENNVPHPIIRFFSSLRMVILRFFNWFVDLFI